MEDFFNETVEENESLDFGRYIHAILSRWWLVLGLFLIIFIPWYLHVDNQPPVYEAEALIGFEDLAGNISKGVIESRMLKMRSRTFAEEAAAKLGLALELLNHKDADTTFIRQDVFHTFSTTKSPEAGEYKINIYPYNYMSLYYENEKIDSLKIVDVNNHVFDFNDVTFSLNPAILNYRGEIDFKVHDFRSTVRSLVAREVIWSSESGNLMSIKLKDKNPHIVYQTTNMLAEMFVAKSLEMQKENSQYMKNYLQEQLSIAQKDLNSSDAAVRVFNENYLEGLDKTTEKVLEEIEELESDNQTMNLYLDELSLINSKLDPSIDSFDPELTIEVIYRQLVQHPIFEDERAMVLLHDEYRVLSEKRDEALEEGIPKSNPEIIEIGTAMRSLEDRIYEESLAVIEKTKKKITKQEGQIDSLQKKLNHLPGEQLRLAKLVRRRRINEDLYNLLLKRYKEAQISEAVMTEQAFILDPAIMPVSPLASDKNKQLLMGAILSLGLGVGLALLLEILDKRIRTRDDVKKYLKMPLLGTIPRVKFDEYELQDSEKTKSISSQIVTHDYSPTPVGEAYRALRTSLLFNKDIGKIKTLIIGSASPGEGKSFTAANLAITMAQQKSKTLLIDADLRRGVLHNTFNVPKKPGLTNYLTGMVSLDDILNETYVPNLSLISCGAMIPNPSELLGSKSMQRFVEGISKRFDFVIFDTPPLYAASDAVILGSLVDGVAILVRSGITNRERVQRKMELFQNVKIRTLGVILNCAGVEVAHDGYSYYAY